MGQCRTVGRAAGLAVRTPRPKAAAQRCPNLPLDGSCSPDAMHSPIPIIGLTGGIGSGKSFVAREFERQGATVIDADQLGHRVLELPEIRAAARNRWGAEIFDPSGQIDRQRLAQIVFAPTAQGAEELAYLEELSHRRIRQMVEQQVAELIERPDVPAIVVDAPLLVEAGWNGFCDKIVYVEAPREVRSNRAKARGWSQEDFDRREQRQESLAVKRGLADVVIDNSGLSEATAHPSGARVAVSRPVRSFRWLTPSRLPVRDNFADLPHPIRLSQSRLCKSRRARSSRAPSRRAHPLRARCLSRKPDHPTADAFRASPFRSLQEIHHGHVRNQEYRHPKAHGFTVDRRLRTRRRSTANR